MGRLVRTAPVVLSMLALAVLVTGCPKRPGTAITSAPPPSAAGRTAQAAAMVPTTTSSPSRGASTTPHPSEFAATDNLKDIHFDFDKYEIRPADAKLLDADAAWLKSRPDDLVLIEGHCDERGNHRVQPGARRAAGEGGHELPDGARCPGEPNHADLLWQGAASLHDPRRGHAGR